MKVTINTMNFTRSAHGIALGPSDMVYAPTSVVSSYNERPAGAFPTAI
jgi:hypothetical protein